MPKLNFILDFIAGGAAGVIIRSLLFSAGERELAREILTIVRGADEKTPAVMQSTLRAVETTCQNAMN